MPELNFDELRRDIHSRKREVERKIWMKKPKERLIRTRQRTDHEIKALDEICLRKWGNAEKSGKVKYISEREWFIGFH